MYRPANPVTAVVCVLVALGLLLALPLLAGADPSTAPLPRPGAPGWVAVAVVVLAQAAAVAWVRRSPTVLLPGLAALGLVPALVAPGPASSLTVVAVVAGVFLAVVARPVDRRRRWGALLATALLVAGAQLVNEVRTGAVGTVTAVAGAVLQAVVVVGLPLLFGLVLAAQRDAQEAREHEVRAVRGEQEALLQAAMSRQRTALSRELHDIAAHHVSGIAVMAAAIGRQVDADPEAAKRSAQQVREQSRAVLDDLRRLVGLLREDADVDRPVENLAAVTALVGSHRAAGAEVELSVPDTVAEPGPLAGLVAFRTVQESLANARRHAPGARCTVRIDADRDDRLTITVRNEAAAAPGDAGGGGFGLIGMRERARLVGADLTHGATPDGGWEVRLTIPLTDAPTRADALTEGLA